MSVLTRPSPSVPSVSDGAWPPECVIAVHFDGRDLRVQGVEQRISSAANPLGRLELHAERSAFEQAVCRADCAVLVIPWLDVAAVSPRVERIRGNAPDVPIIVVTSNAAENARRAVELGVTSAVWLSDLEQQLPSAIRFALERSFLRVVAANAERACHLSATVRASLVGACRARTPVRSLEDLAAIVGVHRTALLAAWQGTPRQYLTPKRLLDWVLLLHATSRKTSRTSWESIAGELCTSEDTVSRIAMRFLDTRLSGLSAATIERVRRGFIEDVLTPLGVRAPVRAW